MICEKDLAYEMSIAMGHAALLKGSETRIFNLPSESVKDFAEYTAKKCSRTTQKTRLSSAEAAELTSGSCADIQEEKRLDSNLESLVDKRSFNAITPGHGGAQGGGAAARPPRPPPAFPRCCNCGSKMHAGTERNCYLWGHPKGKGATGVWPENGGPSLRLEPQEWKDWKVIRHAIFYSYPENAGLKRPKPSGA